MRATTTAPKRERVFMKCAVWSRLIAGESLADGLFRSADVPHPCSGEPT